jgi:hypothetical protein
LEVPIASGGEVAPVALPARMTRRAQVARPPTSERRVWMSAPVAGSIRGQSRQAGGWSRPRGYRAGLVERGPHRYGRWCGNQYAHSNTCANAQGGPEPLPCSDRENWPTPPPRRERRTSVRARELETRGRRRRRYRRSASDSGSRTARFTIAEESRYVASMISVRRSANDVAQHSEPLPRGTTPADRAIRRDRPIPHPLRRKSASAREGYPREWGQSCHRAAAIGDLYGLTLLDQSKKFAGPLAKLEDPYRCHVLFVAHE